AEPTAEDPDAPEAAEAGQAGDDDQAPAAKRPAAKRGKPVTRRAPGAKKPASKRGKPADGSASRAKKPVARRTEPASGRMSRAKKLRRKMVKAKRTASTSVETKLAGMADIVVATAPRTKEPTISSPIRALSNVALNS